MRMVKLLAILSILLTVPIPGYSKDKVKVFQGGSERVFEAGLKAAQKNWRVTFSDRKAMMFTFSTGTSLTTWGMEVGVSLRELDRGRVEVTLRSQKKSQVFAWGAGGRIADKFFNELQRQLDELPAETKKASE